MRDRDLDIVDPDVEHSVDDCRAVAVPAGKPIQREGMKVQAGDYLAVIDVREAEPHEGARPGSELELHLVREHFGIPDGRRMVCGISFGYGDHAHPVNSFRTERAAIGEVARWVG